MTRQLELADKVSQHPVLTCLSPWMENLTIAAHWKGTWCERLLKSMYYVTLRCVRPWVYVGWVVRWQGGWRTVYSMKGLCCQVMKPPGCK